MSGPKKPEQIVRQLAARVRDRRNERVMTLAELARRAGLSGSTIHRVEAAQKAATIISLEKIAKGLGITLSELLEDLGQKPKKVPENPAMLRIVDLLRECSEQEIEYIERVVRVMVNGLEDFR